MTNKEGEVDFVVMEGMKVERMVAEFCYVYRYVCPSTIRLNNQRHKS